MTTGVMMRRTAVNLGMTFKALGETARVVFRKHAANSGELEDAMVELTERGVLDWSSVARNAVDRVGYSSEEDLEDVAQNMMIAIDDWGDKVGQAIRGFSFQVGPAGGTGMARLKKELTFFWFRTVFNFFGWKKRSLDNRPEVEPLGSHDVPVRFEDLVTNDMWKSMRSHVMRRLNMEEPKVRDNLVMMFDVWMDLARSGRMVGRSDVGKRFRSVTGVSRNWFYDLWDVLEKVVFGYLEDVLGIGVSRRVRRQVRVSSIFGDDLMLATYVVCLVDDGMVVV